MFSGNSTQVWKSTEYNEATKQNIELLLGSERGELFSDPYFVLFLRHYLYEPNYNKVYDLIIDTIYSQLALFIPQIRVDRNNITLITDKEKGKIYVRFTATCQIDYQLNTYQLLLFSESA